MSVCFKTLFVCDVLRFEMDGNAIVNSYTWRMMRFGILLGFFLIRVSISKDIYVSRDQYSNDTITCGNLTQPCASLEHAVQMSRDFDTILLDANYTFNHTSHLTIQKNINITSFRETSLTNYSTILFNYLFWDNEYVYFKIGANLSLSKLTLMVHTFGTDYIFKLVSPVGNVCVYNCVFNFLKSTDGDDIEFMNIYDFSHVTPIHWNFQFKSVRFMTHFYHHDNFGEKVDPTINKNMKFQRKTKQQTISIVFAKCQFNDLTFGISSTRFKFTDCYFHFSAILSSFPKGGGRFVISSSVFNKSYVSHEGNDESHMRKRGEYFNNKNQKSWENVFSESFIAIKDTIFDGTNMNQLSVQLDIYATFHTTVKIDSCIFKNARYGAVSLDDADTKMHNVTFSNNRLKDDFGSSNAAVLTSIQGYLDIENCSFINNSAALPHSSSFYVRLQDSAGPPVVATFTMKNTVIEIGIYPLSMKSLASQISYKGGIYTTFSFDNVSMKCPVNSIKTNLEFALLMYCQQCNGGTYNAGQPSGLSWYNISYITELNTTCYKCPYQALCLGNIRSKGNYWGKMNSSGGVHFTLCPPSYCCSTLSTCASYNTCMNNRRGTLCGDCLPGYSISLTSSNKCVMSESCSVRYFWIGYAALVLLCCLFVMYYKDAFLFAISCVKIKKTRTTDCEDSNRDESDAVSYRLLLDESQDVRHKSSSSSTAFISGLVKMAFFFYQTASIIRVNASAKSEYKLPVFIDLFSSIFYLKIDIRSSSTWMDVCPLQTNSVVLVDFIRTSLVFSSLLVLITFIFILSFLKNVLKFHHKFEAFLCRLKGAYIQLLLLGYTVIATFCLQAVYCIAINEKSYLYVQAENTECYRPWQKFIISFIVLWVAPFPMAIYTNCRLLRSLRITPNQFLLASTMPPLTLYYLVKTTVLSKNVQNFNEAGSEEATYILSILNEPFKTFQNGKRLIWEPILLYRRLFLLITSTFILSPIEKLYPAGLLLLMYAIHDLYFKPHAESVLNRLQLVAFHFLGLLTLINLFWAFTNTVDFMQDPNLQTLGEIFLFIELFILLGPIIFCFIYVIFYKAIRFIWKLIFKKQE